MFCTSNFGHVCAVQVDICLVQVWRVVIKIQKITCKHEQAYISTTIY